MAEVIGLTASIVALIEVAAQVTSITYCYIQDVKNASSEITDLLTTTKHLSGVLAALKVYTESFEDDFESEETGLAIIAEPLEECTKLLNQLCEKLESATAKSRVRRALKSLVWPLKCRDTLKYRDRLQWYLALFEVTLTNDMHAITSRMAEYATLGWQRVGDIYEIVQKLKIDYHSSQVESFSEGMLEWLSTVDYDANHRQACSLQQAGTGTWLTDGELFQSWIGADTKEPFLWLSGLPGAGKTVLMSSAIQRAVAVIGERDAIVMFYFDFKIAEKQNALSFFKTILRQLVEQSRVVPEEMKNLYNKYRYSGKKPTTDELRDAFVSLAATFDAVSIMVDALDESTEWPELAKTLLWLSSERFCNIRLLVSSRRKKLISDTLEQSKFSEVMIQNDQVDADIELYVAETLKTSKFMHFSQTLKDLITTKLAAGSQGMFRWAKCQVDSLLKCQTPRAVKAVLDFLPPTLDETYERIVQEIDSEYFELVRRTLLWLILADQGLTLQELAEAVIIEPEVFEIDADSRLLNPAILLDICGSLITLQKTGKVGLAHYSVKEYFLSGRAKIFHVNPVEGHAELARFCLTYLLLDEVQQGSAELRYIWRTFNALPLIRFAGTSWWKHVVANEEAVLELCIQFVAAKQLERAQAIQKLLFEWTLRLYDQHDIGIKGGCLKSMHIVAALNLHKTAEVLLESQAAELDYRADLWGSPLYLAAMHGNEDMINLLLQRGASPNKGRGIYGTPLSAACRANNLAIVKILIAAGADINAAAAKSEYNHALIAAAACARVEIVQYLVENGANVNAQQSEYNTSGLKNPLNASVHASDWDVFNYLLSRGAEYNVEEILAQIVTSRRAGLERGLIAILERRQHTPANLARALCRAASDGRTDLIDLILPYDGDLNLPDHWPKNHETFPLHRAAACGNLEMVKHLLKKGAEVDVSFNNTGTALQYAVHFGRSLEVVELLVRAGANVNAPPGSQTSTALSAAAAPWLGRFQRSLAHQEIFDFLLAHGADPDPVIELHQDTNYYRQKTYTPLMAAAESGRLEMVKHLIDIGVNVNRVSTLAKYPTALHAAARYGEYEVSKALLAAGADPNVAGDILNIAARALVSDFITFDSIAPDADKVFHLLVENGAKLDNVIVKPIPHDCQETVLLTAAYSKHWSAVSELLDLGVDPTGNNSDCIYAAAQGGNLELVRRLFDLGVDPDASERKENLIQLAADNRECPLELIEYLFSKGVSVNAKSSDNPYTRTAIDYAVQNNRADIVRFLCKNGAEEATWCRSNVVNLAINAHQWDIEEILRAHGFKPREKAANEQDPDVKAEEIDETTAYWYRYKDDEEEEQTVEQQRDDEQEVDDAILNDEENAFDAGDEKAATSTSILAGTKEKHAI